MSGILNQPPYFHMTRLDINGNAPWKHIPVVRLYLLYSSVAFPDSLSSTEAKEWQKSSFDKHKDMLPRTLSSCRALSVDVVLPPCAVTSGFPLGHRLWAAGCRAKALSRSVQSAMFGSCTTTQGY